MEELKIYHEKQSRMLCAVHALNNIFQDPKAYSKETLDDISYSLSPDTYVNPHKNPVGLGNYDVNVVMAALDLKGYEAVWFDKRMSPDSLFLDNILGFVINKSSGMNIVGFRLPIKRPHWFSVRQIETTYYNLDSKLSKPSVIGKEDSDMTQFLAHLIEKEKQCEIFLVVKKNVSENKTWKKD